MKSVVLCNFNAFNASFTVVSKTAPNKKSYTVAEIRQILGISRPTAYKLINQNVFQSVRLNSGIRIVKSSFDAWLETRE